MSPAARLNPSLPIPPTRVLLLEELREVPRRANESLQNEPSWTGGASSRSLALEEFLRDQTQGAGREVLRSAQPRAAQGREPRPGPSLRLVGGRGGEQATASGTAIPARKRVLVVDDNALVREALRLTLSYRGYAVSVRCSAEEVLAELDEDVPDLVLTDVQMAGLSGLDLCERLRDQPRWQSLPIVVMSGDTTLIQRALEAGANDFVAKPLKPEGVYQRIRAWLYL